MVTTTPTTAGESAPIVWGAWDAAHRDDPYPLFAAMRSKCPVHQIRLADGHDAWLVIGHEAARQALKDSRLSKDMLAALEANPGVVDEGLPGPDFARHMLAVDGEDHARLRHLVARAFAPARIAALEPAIEGIARDLLDELDAGSSDPVDLIEGFAHPLPFRVISELLGIPTADRSALHRWFRTLFQPWSGSPPPEAVAASDSIVSYLQELVADHRRHPADNLIGVLVSASDEYASLTQKELLSSLFQLIVAGQDTTTSLIGNGVVALLDHPEQLQLLRAEPRRMPAAVEELIRFSAPVPHATFRVSTEPVELGGIEIPAHKQVLVCLGGANHDPSQRESPERFDITRPPAGHLGFGFGPHFCLGVHLARLEGRIAFSALFERFPLLRLAVSRRELHWSHGDGLVLRGLADLPVHLTHPLDS
ncbi:MAG TPA: cytochrome P450 [Frankiaceae bacterium]|jgi:cytochrome P450|nr:cytochrome P450 [Frankiaceae bacterium]